MIYGQWERWVALRVELASLAHQVVTSSVESTVDVMLDAVGCDPRYSDLLTHERFHVRAIAIEVAS